MKQTLLFLILSATVFSALASSCKKEIGVNDDTFLTDKVCYINSNDINNINENSQYYSEIDKAVSNNELLATTYIDKRNTLKHYATRDLFIIGGDCFGTFNPKKYGRFEGKVCSLTTGYQIINSNTIAHLDLALLVDEDFCSGPDYSQVKTVYNGTNYKSISWYVKVTYYTYIENSGKLIISNGTILTESNDALIPDGSSTKYSKYYLSSLK